MTIARSIMPGPTSFSRAMRLATIYGREERTRSRTDHTKVNKAREMERRRRQRLRDGKLIEHDGHYTQIFYAQT